MATMTTNVVPISPEQVAQLIELPVQRESVAIQVSTLVRTASTITRFPLVTSDPTAAWTAEGDEIATSDPTVDDVEVEPAKLAGLVVVTNEAAADTNPAVSALIGNGLARDIAKKLDTAFFGSKGASTTQPAGLEDLAGVTGVAAPAAWADLDVFAEALSNAEGLGLPVNAFVANPADVLALSVLKESSSSLKGLLTPDPTNATRRQIQGVTLLSSPAVTAGTIWGLPRERVIVVQREGTTLAVDRSAYFTSDRTAIRATARFGFGYVHPAAVQRIRLATV